MIAKSMPEIFTRSPETVKAYSELISFANSLGSHEVEEKKTCVHLVAGKAAFLGVHPRKAGLRITIPLDRPIEGNRIAKCEKASAKRYHIDLDLSADKPLDGEIKGWIKEAYRLKADA